MRYVTIAVDDNVRADRLVAKLTGLSGVKVVGLFAKPSKFCECATDSGKSRLGPKFGWWICPECRCPKPGQFHHLRNLLDEPDLPSQFKNVMLWVKEPYLPPREQYGPAIDRVKEQIAQARLRVQGQERRAARRGRRKRRSA